jgi:antitoxin component of MazEF toxin-antitoxin module
MRTVRVRRVGNSNVITIPRELEELGYVEGATVLVEGLPNGDLRVVPEARLRLAINRAVSRNRKALDLLAEYDRAGG